MKLSVVIDSEVGRDSKKGRVIDRGELGLENIIVSVLVIFKERELYLGSSIYT